MKKLLITAGIITMNLLAHAQGIQFEQGSSWRQVLAKAKAEHKAVFVDCYATWCGPCKQMDAEVYPSEETGKVYNAKFISLRLQMDKTAADDEAIKNWYAIAGNFTKDYTVNAYPTFLFFDADGKPRHKHVGSLEVKGFIGLASDAFNPDKQYYSVLKNFRPGKLDTAELKGLARSFVYSDKTLAGRLAADYLARIPVKQYHLRDNLTLMIQLQDDSLVFQTALNYIKNLSRNAVIQPENASFIARLRKHAQVEDFAVYYIDRLKTNEIDDPDDQRFIELFKKDPKVQKIAENYVQHLLDADSKCQSMTKDNLLFTGEMMTSTLGSDFDFFSRNTTFIDSIAGKDFAERKMVYVIVVSAIQPEKNTLVTDEAWDKCEQRYAVAFGNLGQIAVRQERLHYYFDASQKTGDWDAYAKAFRLYYSVIGSLNVFSLNSITWLIFQHCNDKQTLQLAADKMVNVRDGNDPTSQAAFIDTYANLVYKLGNKEDAIHWEGKAAELENEVARKANRKTAPTYQATIDKMQKGQPTW